MSTTMYLRNRAEIAAANCAAKALGYRTTVAALAADDRYVVNIVARLAGGAVSEQRELESAIVDAVSMERDADA